MNYTTFIIVGMARALPAAVKSWNIFFMLELQQITLFLAFAHQPETLQSQPSLPQTIFGGEKVEAEDWPFVVAVDRKDFLCTGTLIASDLVLTAGHCFADNPPLENVRVHFGNNFMNPDFSVPVVRAEVHPNFCGDANCQEDLFDFALIVLETPALNITPVQVLHLQQQWDETMFVGSDVTLVGYGLDEMDTFGIKQWVATTMTSFSTRGLEFHAGGNGKDTCRGDSGGPAFVTLQDGSPLLVGVTSRGLACGDGGVYGLPYPALCWIDEQTGTSLQSECSSCDCLDTDPTRHERNAGCSLSATSRWPMNFLVFLGIFLHRQRRLFSVKNRLFRRPKRRFIHFSR